MRGGSRAAAARIAASGASTPVHVSNASAAWCTSMPSPLTAGSPRARAAARNGVSIGWYTVSTTNWPGLSRSTGERARLPLHPERRGVHHEVEDPGVDVGEQRRVGRRAPGRRPIRPRPVGGRRR